MLLLYMCVCVCVGVCVCGVVWSQQSECSVRKGIEFDESRSSVHKAKFTCCFPKGLLLPRYRAGFGQRLYSASDFSTMYILHT